MNRQETADTEALLREVYQEQRGHYTQALRAAEGLLDALARGTNLEEPTRQLAAHLNRTSAAEIRVQELKRHWQQSGGKPGPELKALLDQVAQLIAQLIDRVKQAETLTVGRQNLLLPELEIQARNRQMQQVYGRTKKL